MTNLAFSQCSRRTYDARLAANHLSCLFNEPLQAGALELCGNRQVDDGEECDCGTPAECQTVDPCCDAATCKIRAGAECARGECCTHECRVCDVPVHACTYTHSSDRARICVDPLVLHATCPTIVTVCTAPVRRTHTASTTACATRRMTIVQRVYAMAADVRVVTHSASIFGAKVCPYISVPKRL
jgi:hypothetical protein